MPILRSANALLLFVQIPKTAGSTVLEYLRSKGPVSFVTADKPLGLALTPQHFHAELLDKLFDDHFFDARFAVVRNPMMRLVSEYRYRAKPPTGWDNLWGLRPRADKARFTFGGTSQGMLDFDSWVDRVFAAYREDPFIYGNHIRPQVDFLSERDTVFRLEDGLKQVYDWIDARTGTLGSHPPERQNVSRGNMPKWSPATQQAVQAFYAEDYSRYYSQAGQ